MNQKGWPTLSVRGYTRRQLTIYGSIATVFAGFGGCAVAHEEEEISHTAESIHQEPSFRATRQHVYEALTDPKRFSKIVQLSRAMLSSRVTVKPTEISQQPGGPFSLFGGHIVGRQIELITNARIVQAWRVVDWNPGVYSIAKFDLQDDGSGCRILFDHTGFPPGKGRHLADGWNVNYWEPLHKYLTS